MELKIGTKMFDVQRITKIRRYGHHIAHVYFDSGAVIAVICGVSVPDGMRYTYPRTYEHLQAFFQRLKAKSRKRRTVLQ